MHRSMQVLGPLVAVLALDQWTKAWARTLMGAPARSVVRGLIELRLTTNRGALFGHRAGIPPQALRWILVAVGLLVALWLLRLAWTAMSTTPRRLRWSYVLALAGVLGNTADRLLRGYVTDFLHLRFFDFVEIGTINLADVAVISGVLLLIPEVLRRQTPPPLSSRVDTTRS